MPRLVEEIFAVGYHQLRLEKQRRQLSSKAADARARLDEKTGFAGVRRLGLTLTDIRALAAVLELAVADRAKVEAVGISDLGEASFHLGQVNALLNLAASAVEEREEEDARIEAL